MRVSSSGFGTTADGATVRRFDADDGERVAFTVIELGAILQSVRAPDRQGEWGEVTLGYDDLASYETDTPYLGATVGRYANRIAGAVFELDGGEYHLAKNERDERHIHGGIHGFNRRVWSGEAVDSAGQVGVRLAYTSPDGEEGYPGTLSVVTSYLLGPEPGTLTMRYEATTDAPTILNLTNHAYWNLADGGACSVEDHLLEIPCTRYLQAEDHVPTGASLEVSGPFDYRTPRRLGDLTSQTSLFGGTGGYDTSYLVEGGGGTLTHCATVRDPRSSRVMEVSTTQPTVHLYSGEWIDVPAGRGGQHYRHRGGLCLETQHAPDSPHQPSFPSVVLRPEERYVEETVHRFSVDGGDGAASSS